jgi:hypothetical protein
MWEATDIRANRVSRLLAILLLFVDSIEHIELPKEALHIVFHVFGDEVDGLGLGLGSPL